MTKSSTRRWPLFRYLADTLQDRFLLPTKRMIILLLLGTPIAVAGYLLGTGYQGFWMYNGLIVLASLIDWFTLPRKTDLSLQRTMPEQADLGQSFQVGIRLYNKSGQFLGYSIVDDLPLTFEEAGPLQGRLVGTEADMTYSTQGNERGQYLFRWLYMRWKNTKSRSRVSPTRCPNRFLWWLRKTRWSTKAPMCCQRPSWTAFCSS